MIKYNNNTINDWNFGDDNIIKVYKHGAVVFYKFDSEQGGYKVCYAVVDDITQYSETEFEDVYDKATEKWYKLNNLDEYEQYGVYGSGRTLCEGSSRLPQGYTEVEYIENTSTAYINTDYYPNQDTRIIAEMQVVTYNSFGRLLGAGNHNTANTISCDYVDNGNTFEISWGGYTGWSQYSMTSNYDKHTYDWNKNSFYIDGTLLDSKTYTAFTCSYKLGIFNVLESGNVPTSNTGRYFYGKLYNFKIYDNDTLVRDFVPAKRDSDSKYGLYDVVNDVFYVSPNNVDFSGGEPITPTECVTTYNGKLTIDNGYEYEWNGSSWVNLGEISGSSRVPDGYVELTHVQTIKQDVSNASAFTVPIDIQSSYNYIIEFMPLDWSSQSYYGDILGNDGDTNFPSYGLFKLDNGWGTEWNRTIASFWNYSFDTRGGRPAGGKYRFYDNTKAKVTMHLHNYDAAQGADMIVENEGYPTSAITSTSALRSGYVVSTGVYNSPLFCTQTSNMRITAYMNFYNLKIETNENVAVYDYIPCKRKSDNKVGLYDVVHNVFHAPLFKLNAGDEASHTEYPKYYTDKSEPLDNLTFSTMEDAQAYAEANCVYDGMHAIIGTDRYYFDSTDDNGWVKVTEYYIVEDVTPNAASGWTISGSSTYNPDSSYYDDFDLETTSTNFETKIAKVTIYGYDHFTYYLRTTGYSTYCYAVATNVDEIQTPPSTMSYNSSSAITNTYTWNKTPKSAVNLSNYRRVTYNNLDKTVEHTFYVYFYGRANGSYVGNATILIPKEQTNENWEQVTFSASSNVASTQKNLYIDGNNSTSGGTQYWYHRWIVGLPSGSHSSYTNYSNYDYCPNVTSSTFTSVASEQRQVNFTYDNTTSKTLSFRLTDGSNVLTPSDTVYYNMVWYNSCNVSTSSSNVTFPRSQSVKVGGRFVFQSSSNRHYIYGYSPNISLNYAYYVDNYQSTFDITYTKLSDEAVTITYTTYDPSDVETPAFKTDITYPYSGGTTSSTTLTSFDVPYTYSYEVSQTSDKFSADSQTFTAGQSSRTISFTLYPNNREFASVSDLEAYAYAWEGMRATVGDTKYKYENGEWVENQHTLPDVPFVLNYNAKQYNASTHSIPMTTGQLNDTDAVAYNNPDNIIDHSADGYITISNSSMRIRKQGQDISLFNRSSNSTSSDLTIVCKAKSTSGENIITNRDGNYNWMYRLKTSGILRFHGVSETGSISWNTSNPDIMSVRTYYSSGTKLVYNNWTQNTSTSPTSFTYGSTNTDSSAAGALFVGYGWNYTSEQWSGDFYWVYMAQANLTDEQVQQVIDYNENL